jgi:hypothetical protein
MSAEDINQQVAATDNTDSSSVAQDAQTQTPSPKMFSEDEVKKMIDDRLKSKEIEHKRKTDAVMKRVAELERKEKEGTATQDERAELSTGKSAQAHAQSQGIHPDAIPYIIEEEMSKKKYAQGVKDAAEKDPQFKAALQDPNSRMLINTDQEFFLKDLPNAAAVMKTLLTNKKENNLMQAKFQEMIYKKEPSIMVQYINDLSDKLEKSSTSPRAPSYTPDANLSDFGDSAQDFDLEKYIKNHR